MNVYYCAGCGETKRAAMLPKADGCSKSSFHRWINIGVVGDEKYECTNCKVVVNTQKIPNSYGCTELIFHEWKKV